MNNKILKKLNNQIHYRKLAELILAILSCLSNRVNPSQDSIDTVLPSLMQILGILNEVRAFFFNAATLFFTRIRKKTLVNIELYNNFLQNEEVSSSIADEMRAEIESLCGSIASPDERSHI